MSILRPGKGWTPVAMTSECAIATCASDGTSPSIGQRYVITGAISNSNHRLVDLGTIPNNPGGIGTVKLAIGLLSNVTFTARFDLVQVVGVDAIDTSHSELDWNHDGVLNYADVSAFIDDFYSVWSNTHIANFHPLNVSGELWALDFGNDGWVSPGDICVFESRFEQLGLLSLQDRCVFATRLQALGLPACQFTTPPCGGGGN